VDEKIGLVKTDILDRIDQVIERVRSDIGSKLDEQIEHIRSDIESKLDVQIEHIKSDIGSKLNNQTGIIRSEIRSNVDENAERVRSEINNEISAQVKSVVLAMNQEIENRTWLSNILDRQLRVNRNNETPEPSHELGLNYFLFEERFRGSREDIKHRQNEFIHYFDGCKNVLDIGCGRGEFLELLQDNGIIGRGIDIDENMVNFCISKGLNVEKIDAVSCLEKIADKSLDGILLDQIIEHLEPDYLIKMLRLCYDKLNFGYHILIETVNPLSLISFVNFYLDMSHKKPIHPETLKFLMTYENFRDIEIKFYSPIPDDLRLKKVRIDGDKGDYHQSLEVYNYNIDMLNNLLYGPQDYIVIGKK
jgi:O-antigen chain-terminating methyltransferase